MRFQRLPRPCANDLHPFVRDEFLELWQAVDDHRDD